MLEKNFDELDNDFITLWSNMFMPGKKEFSKKDMELLEHLAEMGQVNALQSYYLFNEKGINKNVDLVANHFIKKQDDFNIDLLRAHKSCCLSSELNADLNHEWEDVKRWFRFNYQMEVDRSEKWARQELRFRLCDLDFYKFTIRAIEKARDLWKAGDVLAGQRMVEMMSGLSGAWPLAEDQDKIKRSLLTYAKQVRKQLWVEFMKCNWLVDKLIETNPAVAYALGKSLTSPHLRRWFDVDNRKKKVGIEIIRALNTRLYSKTFSDYHKERQEEELSLHNHPTIGGNNLGSYTPEQMGLYDSHSVSSSSDDSDNAEKISDVIKHIKIVNDMTKDI